MELELGVGGAEDRAVGAGKNDLAEGGEGHWGNGLRCELVQGEGGSHGRKFL
jgi:hypothetical protein